MNIDGIWSTAGNAWLLVSAALVLFMTPGLALFYGGLDRGRNLANMMMMNFWCLLWCRCWGWWPASRSRRFRLTPDGSAARVRPPVP